MTKYLLDANVFITAFWNYYDPRFAPAFWDWLARANQDGNVFSIDIVKEELQRKFREGFLFDWASKAGSQFFLRSNCEAIYEVSDWVNQQERWTNSAKRKFRRKQTADLRLIALAKERDYTVVTLEKPQPNAKTKIKIPDVCAELNVECQDTFGMLRKLKPRFSLD